MPLYSRSAAEAPPPEGVQVSRSAGRSEPKPKPADRLVKLVRHYQRPCDWLNIDHDWMVAAGSVYLLDKLNIKREANAHLQNRQ